MSLLVCNDVLACPSPRLVCIDVLVCMDVNFQTAHSLLARGERKATRKRQWDPCCSKAVFVPIASWPCGLMDKALVFGTKDCRFESCQGHALF